MMLTEQEINTIVREAGKGSALNRDGGTSQRIARAIEKAVLDKLAGDVEPVAFRFQKSGVNNGYHYSDNLDGEEPRFLKVWEPLVPATALAAEQAKVRELVDILSRVTHHATALSHDMVYTADTAGKVAAMYAAANSAIAKHGGQP